MKVLQQFHAQKRNPNAKHNNRSTLLTREKEKSKLSIIYDDRNKDDHYNKQQTYLKRKFESSLLHCTYYRIPFKLLADHAVI